jgi:uncharacterized protein (DUF433 family)
VKAVRRSFGEGGLCKPLRAMTVPDFARFGILDYIVRMKQPIVSRNQDVMGGTPVFSGTRVPVKTLLDYLEAGESIDDFLEGFPSVARSHVVAFLEEAKDLLVKSVS